MGRCVVVTRLITSSWQINVPVSTAFSECSCIIVALWSSSSRSLSEWEPKWTASASLPEVEASSCRSLGDETNSASLSRLNTFHAARWFSWRENVHDALRHGPNTGMRTGHFGADKGPRARTARSIRIKRRGRNVLQKESALLCYFRPGWHSKRSMTAANDDIMSAAGGDVRLAPGVQSSPAAGARGSSPSLGTGIVAEGGPAVAGCPLG